MRVVIIEQNNKGNVKKEVYGIHENKIAKEKLEQIVQDFETYLESNDFDLDDNDTINDIVDAINLIDGFYQFDTGDFVYRIDIVSL